MVEKLWALKQCIQSLLIPIIVDSFWMEPHIQNGSTVRLQVHAAFSVNLCGGWVYCGLIASVSTLFPSWIWPIQRVSPPVADTACPVQLTQLQCNASAGTSSSTAPSPRPTPTATWRAAAPRRASSFSLLFFSVFFSPHIGLHFFFFAFWFK